MAENFARVVAKHVADGTTMVDQATVERRLAIYNALRAAPRRPLRRLRLPISPRKPPGERTNVRSENGPRANLFPPSPDDWNPRAHWFLGGAASPPDHSYCGRHGGGMRRHCAGLSEPSRYAFRVPEISRAVFALLS